MRRSRSTGPELPLPAGFIGRFDDSVGVSDDEVAFLLAVVVVILGSPSRRKASDPIRTIAQPCRARTANSTPFRRTELRRVFEVRWIAGAARAGVAKMTGEIRAARGTGPSALENKGPSLFFVVPTNRRDLERELW